MITESESESKMDTVEITLIRDTFSDISTIGKLFINNIYECYTLEDVVREVEGRPVQSWKIDGETAIPRGRYEVIIAHSNRFQRNLPRLLNVPGYDGILIHPGNYSQDTHGCILVGLNKTPTTIKDSKVAFELLLVKIELLINEGKKIYISIK